MHYLDYKFEALETHYMQYIGILTCYVYSEIWNSRPCASAATLVSVASAAHNKHPDLEIHQQNAVDQNMTYCLIITHIKMRYRPSLILDFDLSCQESILPGSWGWCYCFPVVPTYYFKTTWGMNLDLVEIINQNESLAPFSKSLSIFYNKK